MISIIQLVGLLSNGIKIRFYCEYSSSPEKWAGIDVNCECKSKAIATQSTTARGGTVQKKQAKKAKSLYVIYAIKGDNKWNWARLIQLKSTKFFRSIAIILIVSWFGSGRIQRWNFDETCKERENEWWSSTFHDLKSQFNIKLNNKRIIWWWLLIMDSFWDPRLNWWHIAPKKYVPIFSIRVDILNQNKWIFFMAYLLMYYLLNCIDDFEPCGYDKRS